MKSQQFRAARLTPTQVYEIRERYAAGETQGSLARAYGVSIGHVGRIVRGEQWQNYSNPVEGSARERYREPLIREEDIQASLKKLQARLEVDGYPLATPPTDLSDERQSQIYQRIDSEAAKSPEAMLKELDEMKD